MQDIEIRSLDVEPLELRATGDDGQGMSFSGWAARYGEPSLPLPFTERIAPGAFTRTLKARNDVKMFVNHSDLHVLASTRSKTLKLEDRNEGLWVEADLPDVTYARDLAELMRAGIVRTMSFGFTTVKDEWSNDGGERTLQEVRLHEVSVVTSQAAYPTTTAAIRNLTLIAKRTDTDVDALTDAIAALEAGTDLTDDQANVLQEVVDRSRPAPAEPEQPESSPLALMLKQMDLLAKYDL
ncbi:HK97 family phage prohead protease [Candidatus Nanopelagicales bacterium]|nr:HK97 family phage prohead protease [Candidatus Nanopelagicales bacterium]